MNTSLMNAILSIDSYNRGYAQGIIITGNIGKATFIKESDITADGAAVSAGFYASAYSYNGGTVISFRGTDNPLALKGNDVINGWVSGAGFLTSQDGLAFQFYNAVMKSVYAGPNLDPHAAGINISLTGHSLGGGLAGLIGAFYNKPAVMFDNMAFEAAAANIHSLSLAGLSYNAAVKNAVYGSYTPWNPVTFGSLPSQLQTYYLEGEILGINRLAQKTPQYSETLGPGVNLPGSIPLIDEAVARHSMGALAISMYADPTMGTGVGTDWKISASYFWPLLFQDSFASTFIPYGAVPGTLNNNGHFATILQEMLAYSIVNEGTRVFGDTGIVALYNDANDLGKAMTNSGEALPVTLNHYATDISKAFVQYAGELA
ncbi:MAG: hypothetical protein ACREGC_03040, partial [Minisyncoccia bacterium]